MNGTGLSLLQGSENINVLNNCLEREEEEEELKDERRRHEELGNLLQNAFDDLNEDDTTMDSTSNFQSNLGVTTDDKAEKSRINAAVNELYINHQQKQQQQQNHQQNRRLSLFREKNQDMNVVGFVPDTKAEAEIHRLRMMLESRTNELREGQQFTKEQSSKIDELQKRVLITEAELERALAAKNNTHELLVESKEKCSNLENTIEKIRNERKLLETEKNTLLSKLETTENLLCDVQRKYDMVEKDLNWHNERNVELKLKQMEERHRAATEILQERLQQISNKLDKKTSDLDGMTTRYQALQNTHEIMLCEKASRINDLNHNLTELQKRCDELGAKTDYKQDNIRLQKLIDSLQSRIKDQEETMNTLRQRLEATTADLDIMDGVLRQYNNNQEDHHTNSSSTFNNHLSQTQGYFVGSTPIPISVKQLTGLGGVAHRDRLSRLKEELLRSLNELKNKREEARKLQQSVDEQKEEIAKLKLEENNNLVQLNMLREDNIRLSNRYKILQEEYDALRLVKSHYNEKQEQEAEDQQKQKNVLKNELESLKMELNSLKDECFHHENEEKRFKEIIDQMQEERDRLQKFSDELITKYKTEKNEINDKMENLYTDLEKYKQLLKVTQDEYEQTKKLYEDVLQAKESIEFEMKRLKQLDSEKGLQLEKEKSASLQRALQLAEVKALELTKILEVEKLSHTREINDLKEKLEEERLAVAQIKMDDLKDCTKCLDYKAQITKFEIDNLKLSNFNSNYKREIDDLQMELETTQEHMTKLNEQLKLYSDQETLIKELKKKATQFEEYIHRQTQNQFHSNTTSGVVSMATPSSASHPTSASSSQTTTENGGFNVEAPRNLCDKNVGTSFIIQNNENKLQVEWENEKIVPNISQEEIKKVECRVREEMSDIFTEELKKIHSKLQESEDHLLRLTKEYKIVVMELKQRQKEVDILKQVIVAERDRMQEILTTNEQEYELKLQDELVKIEKSLKEELHLKSMRVKELTKELNDRQTQIEAERKSMKAVMKQWEEQCRTLSEVENEWKQKFDTIQQLHETTIDSWRNKYLSAKKMADNYKRYSEDKEAHMLKEYDRLKYGYRVQVANIEKNYATALQKRKLEVNQAGNKTDSVPQIRETIKKDNNTGKQLIRIDEVEDDDVCTITSSNKENDTDAINL